MLLGLQVRDFAIIDTIDIEFDRGMTVLTGETGAGKSILVDALALVLGERGGTGLVRNDAERAEFAGEFDLSEQPSLRAWLVEQALDRDEACIVRRVIGLDGRSRAFINGNAVPLQSLKELGEHLLDIHGQHFHQSLGRHEVQRDLLDHFAALQALRLDAERAFAAWQEQEKRLRELREAETDRASRIDLLVFQTRELEALDLQPDEHDVLIAERHRYRMSNQLVEAVTLALRAIHDEDETNAQSLVADACHQLRRASGIDGELATVQGMLEEASIQVTEAADALHRYRQSLDLDPDRRDWVEERLDAINTLARKHRVEADELPALRASLSGQLEDLQDSQALGDRISRAAEDARSTFIALAKSLSKERKQHGAIFSAQVTDAMQGLGMPDGRFKVVITARDAKDARPWGLDDVAFHISANPGQPLMPLSKIASGGELSRMSLAIQVIASDGSAIPTMVFDEVDAGVGGGVAEMVGRRLGELGGSRQVLCVTHLAQVASIADHHFRIVKLSDGKSTRTAINRLSEDERIEELARMLGGVEITAKSRQHAAEMRKVGKRPPRRGKPRRKTG